MSEAFVTIEGRVLARALKLMHMVVEKRNSYPILGTVRLTADGKSLRVFGTDLDLDLGINLDAIDGRGAFDVCVSPFVLFKIARLAGAAELVIERDGVGLKISSGQMANYELPGMPGPDKHPAMVGARGDLIEAFEDGRLAELLTQVHWCVSNEETRYYLNGVAWQQGTGIGSRFVATDGHRMAICRYGEAPAGAVHASRIIPKKTVALLREIGKSRIAVHGVDVTKLDFVAGGIAVRSKLIDGQYPDVDRVLPRREGFKAEFKVARDEFATAIERAMVFDGRDQQGRALAFTGKPGERMRIGSRHSDKGSAAIELSTIWPESGQAFRLNGRYLRDVVLHCVKQVSLHQVSPGDPITVLDADDTMTRVVMPMRV